MPEPTQGSPVTPAPKPSATPTPPVSGPLAPLEAMLYEWFVYKAPFQFPAALTDFIVKAGPWITLVLAIILLPIILTAITGALFISSLVTASGVVAVAQPTFMLWVSLAVLIAQVVVMFIAIPKLIKQQRSGWLLMFYAALINLAYGLVSSFSYGFFALGSIIWALVSAAIGLYVLFQIRRHYTK